MENPSKEQLEKWNSNPKYWKWNLFYYNKEDNRLIVDKPNPNYGRTFNFAHPKSYLFFVGMLIFFGFVVFMILTTRK